MKDKVRESKFELLRLFAIFCIVYHHLLINGVNICGYNSPYIIDDNGIMPLIINSLLMGGVVNVFLLISGWYGIKSVVPNCIRLCLSCLVYGGIAVLLSCCLWSYDFSLQVLFNTVKVTNYWYITHFILLVAVSPILERSLAHITSRELGYWIIILTIINILFGAGLRILNTNGFNVLNFIWLYYIGRYLKLSFNDNWYRLLYKYCVPIILLVVIAEVILFVVLCKVGHIQKGITFWGYNMPWVVLTSVCTFILFSKIKLQSKFINTCATTVLGIYLMHSGTPLSYIRDEYAKDLFNNWNYAGLLLEAIIVIIGCGLISYPIEILLKNLTKIISNRCKTLNII